MDSIVEISDRIKRFKRISTCGEVNWNNMSIKILLKEYFIEEYKHDLNWDLVSKYQKMSVEFIIIHFEYVNWNIVAGRNLVPLMVAEYYHDFYTKKNKTNIRK